MRQDARVGSWLAVLVLALGGGDALAQQAAESSTLELRKMVHPSFPAGDRAQWPPWMRCLATVTMSTDGVPTDVVVKGCPSPFQARAEAAALKWRWLPPKLDGEPTKAQTTIAMTFVNNGRFGEHCHVVASAGPSGIATFLGSAPRGCRVTGSQLGPVGAEATGPEAVCFVEVRASLGDPPSIVNQDECPDPLREAAANAIGAWDFEVQKRATEQLYRLAFLFSGPPKARRPQAVRAPAP